MAPSSPFDHERVRAGIAWLEERYRVSAREDLFARDQGFLAGSDEVRLSELQAALDDVEAKAILLARGGYGLTRIQGRLDWTRFLAQPRWLVGFSDFTALHLEAARRGVASLHASNVSGLADATSAQRAAFVAALEEPERGAEHEALTVIAAGSAEGPLFGGNLTLLFTQAAAGTLHPPDDAVLFLEDVTETSYRIDRMLTALEARGTFRGVKAVVLGDFTDCGAGKHGVTADSVLHERLGSLGLPVLGGLRAGHAPHNEPLHFGFRARVHAPASGPGRLSLLAPAHRPFSPS